MNKLFIILNKNEDHVKKLIEKHLHGKEDFTILDFTGVFVEGNFGESHFISARTMDPGNTIEKSAIEDFFKFGAMASRVSFTNGDSIRDVRFNRIPLYWITNLGFRHYYYSWGELVFFLIKFSKAHPDFFKIFEVVNIVLDASCSHISKSLISQLGSIPGKINIIRGETHGLLINTIKSFSSLVKGILSSRFKVAWKKTENPNNLNKFVLTYYPLTWNNKLQKDLVLGNLDKLQVDKNVIGYIPLFSNFTDISKWVADTGKIVHTRALVSFKILFKFICKASWAMICIALRRFPDIEINGFCFSGFVLKREILYSLVNNLGMLYQIPVMTEWIRGSSAKCKLFYQDELYITGRIVSFYSRNANGQITSYGCQHGLFTNYDLVYKIANEELNDHKKVDDHVPIPDFLLVWGEYFKQVILKVNSMNPDRVINVGNLKRLSEPSSVAVNNTDKHSKSLLKVLWCANMPSFSVKEFNIIEKYLKTTNDYELTIRMHPSFDIRRMINQMLSKIEHNGEIVYSGNTDINFDILHADVIVTNEVSSVLLDAILMGRPVIRIKSYIFLNDSLEIDHEQAAIYDVGTSDEFLRAIDSIKLRTKAEPFPEFIAQFEANGIGWKQVFA